MKATKLLIPVAAVVAVAVYSAAFIVNQWEVALKLRLGEIITTDYEPGLHWMVPILNNVQTFDARIQTMDARPERFLTAEKKDVIVDYFAKWRIADVAQYFRSTGGSLDKTARLLQERINTSLRDEFGKRTVQEVISGERTEIMDKLTKDSDAKAAELGVEILDVRVKQIDLPPEVSESVYQRMRAERERVARDLRAKGAEAAEKIRANADRERIVIVSNAYREAEKLRGEGDGKAAETYANAYKQDSEFYAFYRSLNAYKNSFQDRSDVMVLQPDSDFFRYLKNRIGK
ncbi:MAG: protease modulator HflC [Candidatus Thiodiazotropha sp. (ex Dulcina madagascariensis)]|nr:protease modulator HflC [Candidatus Thiodiazotropha sp. (ex Dulcina madagascariensis)]